MVMRTDNEAGFCNLQCWCHVPSRGVLKPPCYLCVINSCSLSSKPTTFPTSSVAQIERIPPSAHATLPPQGEGTLRDVNIYTYAFQTAQETPGRNATVTNNRNVETSDTNYRELYVLLPPERELLDRLPPYVEERQSHSFWEHSIQVSPDSPSHTVNHEDVQPQHSIHVNTEELTSRDEMPSSSSNENDRKYISVVAIGSEENYTMERNITADSSAGNVSELFKKLVFDKEQQDSNSLDHSQSRGQNDSYDSNSAMTVSLEEGKSWADSEEARYQQIHKIHKRDSSSEAAERYLQSDEHLHRMWFEESSSKRGNRPGRGQRSRSFEGNGGPGGFYETQWTDLEQLLMANKIL
ncbi:hypothetical protein SK128_013771 [Halocaridina rubra]|uniref:Uncharacterized protein n=1 Tax=Halocaridina rubra TaxID=373956 RepID=A0AAN8WS44_HALRR